MAEVNPPPVPLAPYSTGAVAQQLPGYDPGPVIAAAEQNLADYLNQPVQEILKKLGIPANPEAGSDPTQENQERTDTADPAQSNPLDPSALISPVTQALGTLGSGLFQGMNPTSAFDGVSKAVESASSSMKSAAQSSGSGWQGPAASSAEKGTELAAQNGAEVSQQSQVLKSNAAQAAATAAEARAQIIQIIVEFQATFTQLLTGVPFTIPAIFTAAATAVTKAATVMTTTQAALAGNAAAVTTAGNPINVAQLGYQMMSPALQAATSAMSSGISAGSQALSSGTGAIGQAVSTAAGSTAAGSTAAGTKAFSSNGGLGGGGTGGSAPIQSLVPRAGTNVAGLSGATEAARLAPSAPRVSGVGMAGGPAGGGMGMMPAGASRANASGGHSSPDFLHTTGQGDEIVGDLGTVAPPVLGAAESAEPQEISLST
ncbi:hypothetical protein [Mycobacteroides sp. LB1]|uniref:hypothetical protein n=1 Tax=Mycobacteroides sp. LB1 TaxID=2750814 RepID=UPI0015DD9147|nr:hypothetical protein [Mycobacteroides sp. LB1]